MSHGDEFRVARFDEVLPSEAAPAAVFDALDDDAGAAPVAAIDDLVTTERPTPEHAAPVATLDGGRGRWGAAPGDRQERAPRKRTSPPDDRPRRRRPSAGAASTAEGSATVAGRRGTAPGGSSAPGAVDSGAADGAVPGGEAPDAGSGGSGRPRRRGGPAQIDPDADPVAAAREICLRLLTDRARTRQELAQALQRRGVPDEVADAVLSRFDEVGLIDDAAFAGQWVRSRHQHRGLARRAIAFELRRKGVADDVAGEALAEVDEGSEALRARQLVDRKLRSLTLVTTDERAVAARRLVGMLARKGYGAGTAYRVVREALAAHGADVDDELDTAEPLDD